MSDPRILYIEDEPANRLLVKRVLEAEGYAITEAVDGPSGLEMAAEMKPDLILLDINLPEIDGYALARRFRETPGLQDVPILAVTANVMKGDRERTLEAGCDGYIQKPIDVDRLPQQVKAALASSVGQETAMPEEDVPSGGVGTGDPYGGKVPGRDVSDPHRGGVPERDVGDPYRTGAPRRDAVDPHRGDFPRRGVGRPYRDDGSGSGVDRDDPSQRDADRSDRYGSDVRWDRKRRDDSR